MFPGTPAIRCDKLGGFSWQTQKLFRDGAFAENPLPHLPRPTWRCQSCCRQCCLPWPPLTFLAASLGSGEGWSPGTAGTGLWGCWGGSCTTLPLYHGMVLASSTSPGAIRELQAGQPPAPSAPPAFALPGLFWHFCLCYAFSQPEKYISSGREQHTGRGFLSVTNYCQACIN